MGQNPARDRWVGSQYARVVRNETEYWVEWVTSPPEDPYEEHVTSLQHADSPAAAVQIARRVLAHIRQQIEQKAFFTSAALDEAYTPELDEVYLYVRVPYPADAQSGALLFGYVEGTQGERAEQLRTQVLRQYAVYEQQINELFPLEEARWVLVPEGRRGVAFAAAQTNLSAFSLDALHEQNPSEAQTLFLWMCTHETDTVEVVMMTYLMMRGGARTWLHDYIDSIPERSIKRMWRRMWASYGRSDSGGDDWMSEMADDPALRDAWLDVAAKEKKPRRE